MYGEGRAREARPILETTLELADRLDDKDFRLRALWGLCIDQFNNGQFGKARALADRFANAAANSSDKTDLMLGDRLMAVALHYLGDQNDARLRIERVNASLHVLAEKPKIFPLDLQDIDAIFPGPHPVASGPRRSGPGARRQKHRGRPRQWPRADFLQRAGASRLPDRLLVRRFRGRGAPRRRAARTHRAPRHPAVGPVGTGLQRGGHRQGAATSRPACRCCAKSSIAPAMRASCRAFFPCSANSPHVPARPTRSTAAST